MPAAPTPSVPGCPGKLPAPVGREDGKGMASRSGKFERLARKVGSRRLAGWITTHNPKVRARAQATRKRNAAKKRRRR